MKNKKQNLKAKSKYKRGATIGVIILCFLALIFGVIMTLLFFNIFYFQDENYSLKNKIYNTTDFREFIGNCKDYTSIFISLKCINAQVKQFYIYNLTDDAIELSFDELQTKGGDCKDWSELYARVAKELGYEYNFVILPMYDNVRHRYTIIYNSEGYCNLDGDTISCTKYVIPGK